jgi:hypothetical protein
LRALPAVEKCPVLLANLSYRLYCTYWKEDAMSGNEAPQDRNAGTRGRRKPSTGFPVVSLAEASKILRDAGRYGFDHTVNEFASYMGHTSTNSGAFRQRLAAFRDWKLIGGRGDSVSMTPIGRVIALPPDPEAERAALQEAFRNCVVFNKLYEESQKNTPLDRQGLGRRAVHSFGVSPNSVNKFVESFVESAVIAGFAEEAGDGELVLLESADGAVAAVPVSAEPLPPGPSLRTSSGPRGLGTPVVHQTWPIADGTIVFEIRSERPLPASAYTTVGEVVASLERLAETLAPTPDDVEPAAHSED